ncbi:MAG: DNA polymerase Y family protein [Bacteroidota bacterium]
MAKRFVSIWFRDLITDWLILRKPAYSKLPFVFATPDRGRMIITASCQLTRAQGIHAGMAIADARALVPSLHVFDDTPGRSEKLLRGLAEYCIRYTPVAAIDLPDGIILDATGCAHLWGGERAYLTEINKRFKKAGYHVRMAMADTIGAAWAVARFGQVKAIIESGEHTNALLPLPAAALRLEPGIIARLQKLGLYQAGNFIRMPRPALRRRFGEALLLRIDQALGTEEEMIQPVQPPEIYQERLSCLDPIITATGIEIALNRLLNKLCSRLCQEEKGLRVAICKCYRVDGKIEQMEIGTGHASHNASHLFKLFENKIETIEPGLGIELFILEAPKVEDVPAWQQKLWSGSCGVEDTSLAELLDRLANKIGNGNIHRYLPDEHYWPERSIKLSTALHEKTATAWQTDRPRPAQLLSVPEPIEVTAPVPDYPPMLFRYKDKVHRIKKADGPERIEREWWLEEGPHRDYYHVEDEDGQRYWLFRSGHYSVDKKPRWFIHGFFA